MLAADLLVVGAGPAGCAAAITAARAGHSVRLIDRARFPRDKCCGDGLTTEALRLLERLGVRPSLVANWNPVETVVVRSPTGRILRLALPADGQHAAVVPRLDLDKALVETAREAGVIVHEAAPLVSIALSDDLVESVAEGVGPISSPYVVAADGMWSPTRKLLGLDGNGYRGEWHAFRQYFSGVGPGAEDLVVWFEEDLLPGYAWSFPLPGRRANVGFGIHRSGRWQIQDMKALWRDLLGRPHVRELLGPDAVPEGAHRAWPIPARIGGRHLVLGRVLFAGDATAAADPMTGEGIAQALFTGVAAAEAILAADQADAASVATSYRRAVEHSLAADHRLGRGLSRLLAKPRWVELALRAAGTSGWTRRHFARWMFEDYPRAILGTPRRWHQGMLTPQGAYLGLDPADRRDPGDRKLASV